MPDEIKAGDKVSVDGKAGVVHAVQGGKAIVTMPDGTRIHVPLSSLSKG